MLSVMLHKINYNIKKRFLSIVYIKINIFTVILCKKIVNFFSKSSCFYIENVV